MKTRQGETEKKSAQVKPIKIDKQVAAWMKNWRTEYNQKNWRHRVRPEYSIYTTLLGGKTPRVLLLNRNKHSVWYIKKYNS